MQIGAIITVAGDDPTELPRKNRDDGSTLAHLSSRDILGSNLIQRTVAKLQTLETLPPVILRDASDSGQFLSTRGFAAGNSSNWDDAVAHFVRNDVDTLCLIRASQYTDLDYAELLCFHLQTQSRLTQAYGNHGSLNIAFIDASCLREGDGGYRKAIGNMMTEQRRFYYRGYVNHLKTAADYHELAQDGLFGKCGLCPVGTEIHEGVWLGEQAQVDSTARLSGPMFVGAGSRVGAGCTIADGSSIERNCHIDCGTLVENSWVLQDTYVGISLDVRRSVVSGQKLFHVDRNIEIGISDRRLVGVNLPPSSLFSMVRGGVWRVH